MAEGTFDAAASKAGWRRALVVLNDRGNFGGFALVAAAVDVLLLGSYVWRAAGFTHK